MDRFGSLPRFFFVEDFGLDDAADLAAVFGGLVAGLPVPIAKDLAVGEPAQAPQWRDLQFLHSGASIFVTSLRRATSAPRPSCPNTSAFGREGLQPSPAYSLQVPLDSMRRVAHPKSS